MEPRVDVPQRQVIAAFDPALSSAAAVASGLSLSAQYEVIGYGELRTWSGRPSQRSLLASSLAAPGVGEHLTLRLLLAEGVPETPLDWSVLGLEALEPLPSRARGGEELRIRVRATRAHERRAEVRLGPGRSLEVALVDS